MSAKPTFAEVVAEVEKLPRKGEPMPTERIEALIAEVDGTCWIESGDDVIAALRELMNVRRERDEAREIARIFASPESALMDMRQAREAIRTWRVSAVQRQGR